MNTDDTMAPEGADENDDAPEGGIPADRRPLGYWLRSVDRLISEAFAEAFAAEDVSRRDWMLLNALSGTVDAPGLAEKLARRSRRLDELIERGWVVETGSGWELTDEGRAARERLAGIVQGLRDRVAGAVSAEQYATMTASLEAIARELGWDENARMPGGRGRGFGRGGGFGAGGGGFGRGFGFGRGRGFAPGFGAWPGAWGFGHGPWGFGAASGHHDHPHHDHPHHGHHGHPHHGHGAKSGRGKDERRAERAYERGFSAGFDAAQRGDRAQPAASDTTV